MAECEMLSRCGFFLKYQDTLDLACRGFMSAYCRGSKMNECVRKAYRADRGCAPEDDMLPSGQMMAAQYRK
jgi:hypothetical protein